MTGLASRHLVGFGTMGTVITLAPVCRASLRAGGSLGSLTIAAPEVSSPGASEQRITPPSSRRRPTIATVRLVGVPQVADRPLYRPLQCLSIDGHRLVDPVPEPAVAGGDVQPRPAPRLPGKRSVLGDGPTTRLADLRPRPLHRLTGDEPVNATGLAPVDDHASMPSLAFGAGVSHDPVLVMHRLRATVKSQSAGTGGRRWPAGLGVAAADSPGGAVGPPSLSKNRCG